MKENEYSASFIIKKDNETVFDFAFNVDGSLEDCSEILIGLINQIKKIKIEK